MAKISLINKGAIKNDSLSRKVIGQEELKSEILLEYPWSPMLLKEDTDWLQQTNFKETALLVFDIDNGPESEKLGLHEARQLFSEYKHIIGTSRNHQKEKQTKAGKIKPSADRYRVILFFDSVVSEVELYKALWSHHVASFKLEKIVDATHDAARYFLPCKEIVSENLNGQLLTTNIELKPKRVFKSLLRPEAGEKGRLSRPTLEFIAQQANNLSNWHSKFIKAALDLKAQNYTQEEAAVELAKASPYGALDEEDETQLKDVYTKRESYYLPKKKDNLNWPEVIHSRRGTSSPKKDSVYNLEYLIKDIMKYDLLYDCRSSKIVKDKKFGEPFVERDLGSIRYKCLEYGIMDELGKIDVVVTHEALKKEYDPFESVFFSEEWDGKDHLKALFETITFPHDEPKENLKWYEDFFKRWFRGIAAKYFVPGSQNNVLIFVGKQGVGKSRWFARLAAAWPNGYKEGSVDPSNKDHSLAHLENFIWHIAEFDNTTNNKDVAALKDFLTRSTISERRPYARKSDSGQSICSFCATVNSTDFLHDTSGNRRYLVLPIVSLNPEHTVNINQVFAQAAEEFKNGLPWYFNKEETEQIEKLTDMYRYKDPVTQRLELALKPGDDKLDVHDIIELIKSDNDNYNYISSKAFRTNVGGLLQKMGFIHKNHSGKKIYSVNADALKKASSNANKKGLSGKLAEMEKQ